MTRCPQHKSADVVSTITDREPFYRGVGVKIWHGIQPPHALLEMDDLIQPPDVTDTSTSFV